MKRTKCTKPFQGRIKNKRKRRKKKKVQVLRARADPAPGGWGVRDTGRTGRRKKYTYPYSVQQEANDAQHALAQKPCPAIISSNARRPSIFWPSS